MARSFTFRLWQIGIGSALFLLTAVLTNFFLPAEKRVHVNELGYDFRALYIAGYMANHGQSGEFYNVNAVGKFDEQIARENHLNLKTDKLLPSSPRLMC